MALTITSAPVEELLGTEEAKRHLRILSGDLDDEVASKVREVRDDCERETQRTFRTAVTRVWTHEEWWCGELVMPWPPLLGVTSITYYDEDNASQTLSAGNYHVQLSTDGFGRIVWATDADLPDVYERPDAISVTFTTGYANAAAVPPCAMLAMKTRLSQAWGDGDDRASERATKSLLGKVDCTGYA